MSHEVFEIIKGMDLRAADMQLALHCAPLIMGLKVSNLLIVQKEQAENIQHLLEQTEISCFILYEGTQKTVMLLYRDGLLQHCLAEPQTVHMLCQYGYHALAYGHPVLAHGCHNLPYGYPALAHGCHNLPYGYPALAHEYPALAYGCPALPHGCPALPFEGLLSEFAGRYAAYMQDGAVFPHEMGLFLGYPVEDVRGFVENHGKNFLCAGYWKVYQDEKEKVRLFHKFDLAKEVLIRLAAEGIRMLDIINICSRYQNICVQ